MCDDVFNHLFQILEADIMSGVSMLNTPSHLIIGFVAPQLNDECIIITRRDWLRYWLECHTS
jgi:hypothetical protein